MCFTVVVSSQAQQRKLSSKNKKQSVRETAQAATQVADTVVASRKSAKTKNKRNETANKKERPQKIEKIKIPKEKKDWSKVDLSKRPADHFMLQTGFQTWVNTTDSINTSGLGRFLNVYVMLDKPSKTNPHFSTAYGLGITTDNMYFGNSNYVNIKGGSSVAFGSSGSNSYKKMKLSTLYVQIPVELRYYSNPANPNKSWKFAIGAKGGLLLKAYTKSKNYLDNNGRSVYGPSYVMKEKNNEYFNSLDARGTVRIGYGIFSLYSDFQLTPIFKPSSGPGVHNFNFGIAISGL
jgi:hypothetical protein